ncbi:hypothetical protein V8E53_013538 [Lactarius tabidus]
MARLPLDNLVTLAAHDLYPSRNKGALSILFFWLHLSHRWTLLQRVQLGPVTAGLLMMLLPGDKCLLERPPLPSLTELVMVGFSSYSLSTPPLLAEAVMKRAKQGVPLEKIDLRMYDPPPDPHPGDWLQSLNEISGVMR